MSGQGQSDACLCLMETIYQLGQGRLLDCSRVSYWHSFGMNSGKESKETLLKNLLDSFKKQPLDIVQKTPSRRHRLEDIRRQTVTVYKKMSLLLASFWSISVKHLTSYSEPKSPRCFIYLNYQLGLASPLVQPEIRYTSQDSHLVKPIRIPISHLNTVSTLQSLQASQIIATQTRSPSRHFLLSQLEEHSAVDLSQTLGDQSAQ